MVNNTEQNKMTQEILKGIPTTAADWYLYSDKEGASDAAMKIAQTLSDAIRSCFTVNIALDSEARDQARNTVFLLTHRALDEASDFGATDGETYDVVARIVNKAFPREDKFNW
jgi:hypothetical protein